MTIARFIVITLFAIMLTSCSVFMAAEQNDKKNVELFNIGTPRSMLLAEFGMPTASETREGKTYEIHKFVQGYSTGARARRAVFHGTADVLTLGLWDVVGAPVKEAFGGDEMAYEVRYDDDNRVDRVIALKK